MISNKIKTRLVTIVLALAALSAVVTATLSSDADAGPHCAKKGDQKHACCDGYCSALHEPTQAPDHYQSCYDGCMSYKTVDDPTTPSDPTSL